MPAITVENVYKNFKVYHDKGYSLKEKILFWQRNAYETRTVLNGISFKVNKGEAVGLIGKNGSGKSTTLKLLSRIMYPDKGVVNINGRVACLIELGAGFHPDMSGRENIYINASIFGLTKKEIDDKLQQIIDFSELWDFIDNPVRTYSSGMYMRLAFAVAINVAADILLIDEILAVGGNIEEFLQGAKDMDEYCQKADIKENPAFINAVLKYLAYCKGVDIEVFMPYCMRLKALSEWYVQLLAESLGKRFDRNGQEVNYGRTPVVAVGTTDMHAQTQQHQEGKRNKIIQFVEVNQIENDITIKNPFNDVEVLSKYTGLKMHDALKIALDANEKALNSDNRYNAKFVIPQINEYYLGQFMYFLMLSVAYEGEIANVDAYNQPGVEIYKKFMKEEL